MKRTGDWGRKKRLTAKTQPSRTGALRRQSERTRAAAAKPSRSKPLVSNPKPVTPEEKRARDLVRDRAQDQCEGCGRPGPAEWSHRIGAAQGGPYSAENGMALCGDLTGGHCPPDANGSQSHGGGCHPWAHRWPEGAKARGWMLHPSCNPATEPALLHGLGWCLLAADGRAIPISRNEDAA